MKVHRTDVDNTAYFTLEGRLDTQTVSEFEDVIKAVSLPDGDIVIDVKDLEYISSAGLRMFLVLAKTADKNNAKVKVNNMRPEVCEIFEVTGFSEMFEITKV